MTMIQSPQPMGSKIFKNSHEACEYINAIERQKAWVRRKKMDVYPPFPSNIVCFLLPLSVIEGLFLPKEKEAVERELGWLKY